jgi:hypothetical protein
MTGLALPLSDLPTALVQAHRLAERVHDREGRPEYQFHWWQVPTVLPVRWGGRLDVLPWGSKARRGPLPYGGWVSEEHVAAGVLGRCEEAVIPAVLGFQMGTWFLINEGVRGAVVFTRAGPVVYMLTAPASNYYRNMTEQSPTMPVFVNQVI